MNRIIILTIFGLLLFSACEEEDSYITMQYQVTKCSDPWQTHEGNTEMEIKDAAETYLLEELDVDVEFIEVTYDVAISQDCESCQCLSGNIITLQTEEEYIETLEEVGFVVI